MMKKFVTAAVAAVLAVSMCIGCKPKQQTGGIILDNRETITVSLFTAGFGSDWMVELINQYNAETAGSTYQFNMAPAHQDNIGTITNKVKAGVHNADIYINDESDFHQLANEGYLLDMSSVWAAKPDAEYPDRTIREKILDNELYEKAYTINGKIYGVPWTQGLFSIIYDHDLFEEQGFLLTDTTTENGLTVGMDKKEGTFDDGLPATMTEFRQLCEDLVDAGIDPFVYSDQYGGGYTIPILETIWCRYDGYDNYERTFDYTGEYESPTTGVKTPLTPADGWKIYSDMTEGRLKAVDFMADFVLNTDYYDENRKGVSHTASEELFVFSHNSGQKRVAMHFNGAFWENEARNAFETDVIRNAGDPSLAYGKRDFRFMPIPAYEGEHASSDGKIYLSTNANGSIIALDTKNAEKNQAILDFITYLVSDESLGFFTQRTGSVPAYVYEMDEEELSQVSLFGQSMYTMTQSPDVKIIRPSLLRTNSTIYFLPEAPQRWWASKPDGSLYTHCYDGVVNMGKEAYVQSITTRYPQSVWNDLYSSAWA